MIFFTLAHVGSGRFNKLSGRLNIKHLKDKKSQLIQWVARYLHITIVTIQGPLTIYAYLCPPCIIFNAELICLRACLPVFKVWCEIICFWTKIPCTCYSHYLFWILSNLYRLGACWGDICEATYLWIILLSISEIYEFFSSSHFCVEWMLIYIYESSKAQMGTEHCIKGNEQHYIFTKL